MPNRKLVSLAILTAALAAAPCRAAGDVAVVLYQPQQQLQTHHHTRPCDTASTLTGGGLFGALIDGGVEKARKRKDQRISATLMDASGTRAPADDLLQRIRADVIYLKEPFVLWDSLNREGLHVARKKFYAPPDAVAISKKATRNWYKAAPPLLDYTSFLDQGIRHVVELRPRLAFESEGHKSDAGYMGGRVEIWVLDLAARRIVANTTMSAGFSASGGLQSIPVSKELWENVPPRPESSERVYGPMPRPEPKGELGEAVATNFRILDERIRERIRGFLTRDLAVMPNDSAARLDRNTSDATSVN